MKGSRPEQAVLTKNTDLSKTDETRRVIEAMVDGLNDHRIDDIGEFFAEGFRWIGNQGCGTKVGLKEFQNNWQRPFQAAFSNKVCIDEARLYMAENVIGLQYLHQNKIIFRDLKPENVVQDEKGHVNLTDFGLSKDNMGRLDHTQTFFGPITFLAPE